MHVSIFRGHAEPQAVITREGLWADFATAFAQPADAATPKGDLPLWSPATFLEGYRSAATVEAVHALTLDVDAAPVPGRAELERALAPYRAVAHSSSSATATAPRWRAAIDLSRPVTGDEYRRLWGAFVSSLSFPVGQEAKDPSRAWYAARVGSDGYYESFETTGAPIDVDAVLATVPAEAPAPTVGPSCTPAAPANRRALAADMLGKAWPAGGRHGAQMALAGALKRDGWSREAALEFLCDVCRAAGDENRGKREKTIEHTWSTGAPLTGWSRLGETVDRVVVGAARGMLDGTANDAAHLADIVGGIGAVAEARSAPDDEDDIDRAFDALRTDRKPTPRGRKLALPTTFDWSAPIDPPTYLVHGLIPAETVGMFVAQGSSLKTWTALDIGVAAAKGVPWLGHFTTTKTRVLVVDFESGAYELRRRVGILSPGGVEGLIPLAYPDERIDDLEFWKATARAVREHGIGLVIVDSLAAGAAGVDENETDAALPLKAAAKLSEVTGATVLVIHHARKDDGDDRKMVRGSTAIYADCDWAYRFVEVTEKDGVRQMDMKCIKPCMGPKPAPVRIELSDSGLRMVTDEETSVAQAVAESDSEVRAAILLVLANGPVPSKKKLREATNKGTARVDTELDALIKLGEVVNIEGSGYALDDDDRRRERVRVCLRAGRYASPATLATASYVSTRFVEGMRQEGLVTRSAEGKMLWVDRSASEH